MLAVPGMLVVQGTQGGGEAAYLGYPGGIYRGVYPPQGTRRHTGYIPPRYQGGILGYTHPGYTHTVAYWAIHTLRYTHREA